MWNWFTKVFGIKKSPQRRKVQFDIPFEQLDNQPGAKSVEQQTKGNKPVPKDP
jgi:hypothetical protein